MTTTMDEVSTEVEAYRTLLAERPRQLPKLSRTGQESLLAIQGDQEAWEDLAQCENLEDDIALRLATEASDTVLRELAGREDLSEAVQSTIADRGSRATLYAMVGGFDRSEAVAVRIAERSDQQTLAFHASFGDLPLSAQKIVAERGEESALVNLVMMHKITDPGLLITLSFKECHAMWDYLQVPEKLLWKGEVGYQFVAVHYSAVNVRFAKKHGIPFEEWKALGEKWQGSLAGLLEAWKLTQR